MSTNRLSIVVAGGGTAGHIEPAMAVADAVKDLDPTATVTALGTRRGLENRLVPERGYPLELIEPVPLPRKVSADLARVPLRLRAATHQARAVFDRVDADALVGFGGYVAIPAYVAARKARAAHRIPVIVHEANARAGVANRVGARVADTVFTAVADCGIDGEVVGIPVRSSITSLDRRALRAQAREFFGLDPEAPTLLVFGGSQGAQSLNRAVSGAAPALARKGIGVLHAHGPKNSVDVAPSSGPAYVAVPYISRMDLAYAAADLAVCRSGAMTVAELSATGLPAVYVPLPHGNGEQRLNALPVVAAGGAVIVDDKDLTSEWVSTGVGELMTIPGKLESMAAAAAGMGHRNAASVVATRALELAQDHARTRTR